jgi:type II secretory pathway component PulF
MAGLPTSKPSRAASSGTELASACPSFGSIAHKICLARFARTLASLVRSGVPILEVLNIVANTAGNVVMEKAVRTASTDIERGDGISAALGKHPIFPSMIIRMMTAGEQTGKIDAMLERVADFLDEEIETTLSGLTSLIEPILIVFLGVVVGGIVVCMFLPIFQDEPDHHATGRSSQIPILRVLTPGKSQPGVALPARIRACA